MLVVEGQNAMIALVGGGAAFSVVFAHHRGTLPA
jgi:hypothetical protein